jgi:hypothetical protein
MQSEWKVREINQSWPVLRCHLPRYTEKEHGNIERKSSGLDVNPGPP